MGLPSINITFTSQAASSIEKSEKGIVAIIIRDSGANGAYTLTKTTQIPDELGSENQAYITRAFTGYVNPPKKIILYVLPEDATDLSDALEYFETQQFDYLVGPMDISTTECTEIVTWIKSMRTDGFTPKAVLPNVAADSEAIVNFTTGGISDGTNTFTAAEFCSRIAGLIAGTPMNISCTYATIPEITSVDKLTKSEVDAAIEAGEFIIYYDGAKVKTGRAVNSLQTTTEDKGDAFKKIKIVEAMDMIKTDLRTTIEDSYIGKYANSYDNKCVLITAIKSYLGEFESEGILESGTSTVEIDVDAQETYLSGKGTDTSEMTEEEIKTASTGSEVFFKSSITILDAIEDVTIDFTI